MAFRSFAWRGLRPTLALIFAAGVLAGCGSTYSDGVSSLLVDPAEFDGYDCKNLIVQLNNLNKREKELRNFIDRADESASGVVIGAMAYRSEYQTVLEQKKVLQRTAADKKCQMVPTFASDQTIR
jgi:hypothetical protein